LVILAASVFEISHRKADRQTNKRASTNAAENPTHVTTTIVDTDNSVLVITADDNVVVKPRS